jgi:hypothetical protein
MCMQCVAQGAPFVGVAVTMLNRRNLKTWAADTWQRAHRMAPVPAPDGPESTPDVQTAPAFAPAPATVRTSAADEPVGAGV